MLTALMSNREDLKDRRTPLAVSVLREVLFPIGSIKSHRRNSGGKLEAAAALGDNLVQHRQANDLVDRWAPRHQDVRSAGDGDSVLSKQCIFVRSRWSNHALRESGGGVLGGFGG